MPACLKSFQKRLFQASAFAISVSLSDLEQESCPFPRGFGYPRLTIPRPVQLSISKSSCCKASRNDPKLEYCIRHAGLPVNKDLPGRPNTPLIPDPLRSRKMTCHLKTPVDHGRIQITQRGLQRQITVLAYTLPSKYDSSIVPFGNLDSTSRLGINHQAQLTYFAPPTRLPLVRLPLATKCILPADHDRTSLQPLTPLPAMDQDNRLSRTSQLSYDTKSHILLSSDYILGIASYQQKYIAMVYFRYSGLP
ncbi:hypothetical protein BD779DRAFT_880568 [Infundibulicybe gibba]|nr:hypothetical protein BD779DRAFT_880568 [Infundibulicybe gibba]